MPLSPDITMITNYKFFPDDKNHSKSVKRRKKKTLTTNRRLPRMKPSRLFSPDSSSLINSGPQAKQLSKDDRKQKSRRDWSSLSMDLIGKVINPTSPMAQSLTSQEAGRKEMPILTVNAHQSSSSVNVSSDEATTQKLKQLLEEVIGPEFALGPDILEPVQLVCILHLLKQDNRNLENHIGSLEEKKRQLVALNSQLECGVIDD